VALFHHPHKNVPEETQEAHNGLQVRNPTGRDGRNGEPGSVAEERKEHS
jgi:hypothetical protein